MLGDGKARALGPRLLGAQRGRARAGSLGPYRSGRGVRGAEAEGPSARPGREERRPRPALARFPSSGESVGRLARERRGRRCVCGGPDGGELPPKRLNSMTGGQERLARRRFTLSNRLPGEVAARLRLVNGSWPAAPLLPVPREPWSQSSQLFTGGRATGGGRIPEGRKEPGRSLHCPPQQRELARSRSQPGITHGCVIRSE